MFALRRRGERSSSSAGLALGNDVLQRVVRVPERPRRLLPDANGTEATRTGAVSVEESIFGDAAEKADDPPAAVSQGQDAQGAADHEDKGDAEAQTDASDELKVVVSIKGDRAVIGVQQPSSDPHIESFDGHDLPALAQKVAAVTERAKAK